MKNVIFVIIGILIHLDGYGQGIQDMPRRMITANLGVGKHGTGDLYGFMSGFEYEKMFLPRFSWSTEFGTSIHDGKELLLVQVDGFPQEDMSYRYTIAGMQLSGKVGFHAVRTSIADYGVKLGAAARYQSSSLADVSETLYPILTGYPIPVRILRNIEPQRTIAAVAILQLFARYTFKGNILVGALVGAQMDTNGDVIIPQFSLSIGRRF